MTTGVAVSPMNVTERTESAGMVLLTYDDGTSVLYPNRPTESDGHISWSPLGEKDAIVTGVMVQTTFPSMWGPVKSRWWNSECHLCYRGVCLTRVFVYAGDSTFVIHGSLEA